METANMRIVSRLEQDIARFRAGEIDIAEIQSAVLAHGHAIEAADREWRDLVDHVEGNIDMIRFTVDKDGQKERVLILLGKMLQAARNLLVSGGNHGA